MQDKSNSQGAGPRDNPRNWGSGYQAPLEVDASWVHLLDNPLY